MLRDFYPLIDEFRQYYRAICDNKDTNQGVSKATVDNVS